MYIKFSNDSKFWELVKFSENEYWCYYRHTVPNPNNVKVIDVDYGLKAPRYFDYNDWKSLEGDTLLQSIHTRKRETDSAYPLPLIYYMKFVMGYEKMEYVRSTFYKFKR